MMLRSPNQYPTNIYGHWHYFRRAPAAYRSFDEPIYSKASLKTAALEIPRVRRDAMTEAGNLCWASLAEHSAAAKGLATHSAAIRYNAAKQRALARGFAYTPA